MQHYPATIAVAVACFCALLAPTVRAAQLTRGSVRKAGVDQAGVASQSPIGRIVSLLSELRAKVEQDGGVEQKSYDKYACWCEDTLAQKASDITAGKENIEELHTLIVKLKGELGAHAANIQQLKKDITANVASQKEATEVRSKEDGTYREERAESEQCIGAL